MHNIFTVAASSKNALPGERKYWHVSPDHQLLVSYPYIAPQQENPFFQHTKNIIDDYFPLHDQD